MDSIESVKSNLFDTKIQVIKITETGIIKKSDDTIFTTKIGTSIALLDPFFEGVLPLIGTQDDQISIPCVNITPYDINYIVDVVLETKKEAHYVLIFDFTDHYASSHTLTQEKNEASIEKHKLAFDRTLMAAKEQFKNHFIANLNHEIRNPLNNLLGFMELLAKTKLTYEQQETLLVMQKTGAQLKVLMDDLLDISKMERGILNVKNIPFNLKIFLTDLQKHFSTRDRSKNLKFNLNIEPDVPITLFGDPTRLYQIFFNLIDNAYNNTNEGTLSIKSSLVTPPKNGVANLQFIVTDDGQGISEEEVQSIFDEYYQLQLGKVKPIGQGLGLRIVKDFVTLLKGSITMESNVDTGTKYTIGLPFEIRTKPEKQKSVPKGSGVIVSKRILVVEDEQMSQVLFMKTFLNNSKGYYIELAATLEQTSKLLEKRKYRAVVLKTKYDENTGEEIIKYIRNHTQPYVSELPILVVSGRTMPDEQQELMDSGASLFLKKPYTKKELFKSIEKLL